MKFIKQIDRLTNYNAINIGVIIIKRGSLKRILFTALLVVIVLSLIEYLMPDISNILYFVFVGISAFVGSLIGNKLFPVKE